MENSQVQPEVDIRSVGPAIADALDMAAGMLRGIPPPTDAKNAQVGTEGVGKVQMDVIEQIVSGEIPRAIIFYPTGYASLGWCPINITAMEIRGMCEGYLEAQQGFIPKE